MKALALSTYVAPNRMHDAGFGIPRIAILPRARWEAALDVRQRWREWYEEALDPWKPADERRTIVRGLAGHRRRVSERSAVDALIRQGHDDLLPFDPEWHSRGGLLQRGELPRTLLGGG